MSAKKITFDQLKNIMNERAGQPGMPNPSSVANLRTSLSLFLEERALTWHDMVGSTFRGGYKTAREAHLESLRLVDKPAAYIANRGSLLESWRILVRLLDHEGSAIDGKITPLQSAIIGLFSSQKYRVQTTCRATGIPISSLKRWMKGELPQRGKEHYLRRLEIHCEQVAGYLIDLLPYRLKAAAPTPVPLEERDPYRALLAELATQPYRLHPSSTPPLVKAQWCGLFAYKTSMSLVAADNVSGEEPSILQRLLQVKEEEQDKQWRLVPPLQGDTLADRWIDCTWGKVCPTAALSFGYVAGFLGWARLPPERGGAGLRDDQLTLALCADIGLVERFLDWRVTRMKQVNGGVLSFMSFLKMLCNDSTGYLPQRPDIGATIGIGDPMAWRAHCKETHKRFCSVVRKIRPSKKQSRNPSAPIQRALDLPMPLDDFVLAARRLEANRPTTGGIWEATWARDLLLFVLTMSNPLRSRNLQKLTYRTDNTGQLRQTRSGEWRIVIGAEHFKNERGAAKDTIYDRAVDESVWPYIERYFKTYRKMLGGTTNLVFVSYTSPNKAWKRIGRRYFQLTRRYLSGCHGVQIHVIRDVVATSIIINTNGNYVLAAQVLHDKPATVEANYVHLLKGFADRGRAAVLGSTMAKIHSRKACEEAPLAEV